MSETLYPGNNEFMIRRFVVLGAVVGLLGVGDFTARSMVSSMATERAQASAPAGSSVSASIGSFPFVPPLLLGGSISRVDVHLENVSARVITFAKLDIDLRGVKLDRDRLLSKRKVRITEIDKGIVEATLTQEALQDALHVPVTISEGTVNLEVLGKKIPVTVAVDDSGRLSLTGPGLTRSFSLTIPKTDYIPCLGGVTVLSGRIKFSCEVNEVPPALLDVAQSAAD